jgi:hypothetical protein
VKRRAMPKALDIADLTGEQLAEHRDAARRLATLLEQRARLASAARYDSEPWIANGRLSVT